MYFLIFLLKQIIEISEKMVFYKVYIGYIGGTPCSVRSSIKYSIGYSILCKKEMWSGVILGPMFGEGTFKGSRRKALSGTAGPGEKVREKKEMKPLT